MSDTGYCILIQHSPEIYPLPLTCTKLTVYRQNCGKISCTQLTDQMCFRHNPKPTSIFHCRKHIVAIKHLLINIRIFFGFIRLLFYISLTFLNKFVVVMLLPGYCFCCCFGIVRAFNFYFQFFFSSTDHHPTDHS